MTATEDDIPPLEVQTKSDVDRLTPEARAAHDRFMAAAERLEQLGVEVIEALAEAEACGVEVRQLDIDVIKTRLAEQIPYALKFKAGQLLPTRIGRLIIRVPNVKAKGGGDGSPAV